MSDTEEQESILNNLSKTRQLWNSKADLGTSNFLAPKSPVATSASSAHKNQLPNGCAPTPTDVVRPDEQVVEDFELPNIKAMRSQYEVQNSDSSSKFIPMPSAKSPAAMAREQSQKRDHVPPPEPVNRVEPSPEEETYGVELNKLKAQFESAAKAASKTRPKSPRNVSNAAIKEQVNKSPPTRQQSSGNVNKKIRFEDEMTPTNEHYETEQRSETENLAVNLSGLKSQFESRKDEQLVTPELSKRKAQPEKTGYNRIASSPRQQTPAAEVDGSSHDDQNVTPADEPVKSGEPVFDEMIGKESVKDRLKRYKSMTESTHSPRPAVNKASQKRELTPILKRDSESSGSKVSDELEVVRSPPAGTRETPDYIPSVDLRHTKALFETSQPKGSPRTRSSRSSTSSSSRTGRSSISSSSRESRSSSRQSITSSRSSSSKRSKSPALSNEDASTTSGAQSEQSMSEVVRPPPAGTKETADYVPAVKVSSMKNMFENSKSPASPPLPVSPPRRQQSRENWTSSERKEDNVDGETAKTISDEKDVVRPATAGTKEVPDYSISTDVLKSRVAIFNAPPPEQYTPRNTVNTKETTIPREIVNSQSDQPDTDYELSLSLKDTKKMFEKGGNVATPNSPAPRQATTPRSPPPAAEVVRPPPAGTREIDIVPVADLRSVKSRFENQQGVAVEPSTRKKPIDIRMEAAEAQRREKEIASKTVMVSIVGDNKPDGQDFEDEPEPQNLEVPEPKEPEPVTKQPEPKPRHVEAAAAVEAQAKQVEEPDMTQEDTKEPEVTQEDREDSKQDSDTESEGEYVLQKSQVEIEQNSQILDDQAAAVIPVRVAVSDATNEGGTSSSSSSDVEDRDSLDEAALDHSKSSQDSSDSLEIEISKPKYQIADLQQEESGTSLREEDEEEDFDKPHFHYDYDDSDTAPETTHNVATENSQPQNAILLDTSFSDNLMDNGGSLLDGIPVVSDVNQSSPLDSDLLFGGSASKGGDILLLDPLTSGPPPQSDPTPNSSVDLLNGFVDVKSAKHAEPSGAFDAFAKADPFDIFNTTPAATESKTENASKDPFDLF